MGRLAAEAGPWGGDWLGLGRGGGPAAEAGPVGGGTGWGWAVGGDRDWLLRLGHGEGLAAEAGPGPWGGTGC